MTIPAVAVGLGIVNVVVVCGNVAVLYVLITQKSLHTPTNFIVLSLTLSDFLLGVCILPFSILQVSINNALCANVNSFGY